MVNLLSKIAVVGVAFVAVLYQFIFKSLIYEVLGHGRSISPLSSFKGVTCEKVTELGLEACEDMWFHDATGLLYMACSNSQSKPDWFPAVNYFNASGRSLTDRIAVLDTRAPGRLASRIKWLRTENFAGNNGDGTLNLHGFDVWIDKNSDILRIALINHRPPFDPVTGAPLDASKVGANSTIEIFQTKTGSDTMRHIRTHSNKVISTPNRVQWVNENAFIFTNDHNSKTGIRRHLEPFLGGGSIGYCDRRSCHIAKQFGSDFCLPNGLVRGRDGYFYVPSTLSGEVRIYTINEDKMLDQVSEFKVPYPVDNISMDNKGELYAAAFPQTYKWSQSSKDPFNVDVPSTIFHIQPAGWNKAKKGQPSTKAYSVEKVFEDDGSTLPGSTVVVHDARTGRYFMGGAVSPYITICEKKVIDVTSKAPVG